MTLLTAAWECVSPITLVNSFRKASISSESQAQSQSDDDDLFKCLLHSLKNFKTGVNLQLTFTVDGYVDADEDVVTSETQHLTDSEIIARVTQTQLDAAEHRETMKFNCSNRSSNLLLLTFLSCKTGYLNTP